MAGVSLHFTWDYIKGKANVADPLSRHPEFLNAVCGATSPLGDNDIDLVPKLKERASDLIDQIKTGYDYDDWFWNPRNTRALSFENKLWLREGLVVVPNANDLRSKLMSLHHDTPIAGHFARDKTVHFIRQNYWWPSMTKDVDKFVRTCDSCQRNKISTMKPGGLLQPCSCLISVGKEFLWI